MNLFSFVERLMLKLSGLPGLQFLNTYVTEFRGRKSHIQQQLEGYQGYVRAARGAGADVAQAARGAKHEEPDDDDEYEEDVDEDETFMQ